MEQTRSFLREKSMTILYQIFLYEKEGIKYDQKEVIREVMEIESDFVNNIVLNVLEKRKELSKVANSYLKSWTVDRLGKTDEAIILMGIYELLYTDTPDVVCINESIELSKKYSDDKVRKMINSVMDKVLKSKE